jgi:hypothetical protein
MPTPILLLGIEMKLAGSLRRNRRFVVAAAA